MLSPAHRVAAVLASMLTPRSRLLAGKYSQSPNGRV
jgi:hypothetical protein